MDIKNRQIGIGEKPAKSADSQVVLFDSGSFDSGRGKMMTFGFAEGYASPPVESSPGVALQIADKKDSMFVSDLEVSLEVMRQEASIEDAEKLQVIRAELKLILTGTKP